MWVTKCIPVINLFGIISRNVKKDNFLHRVKIPLIQFRTINLLPRKKTSKDKPIIKEDKDDTLDIQQEEYAEEKEEEKTFRDIVKKDGKRLGGEIEELFGYSKFNKTAAEIDLWIHTLTQKKNKIDKSLLTIYLKYWKDFRTWIFLKYPKYGNLLNENDEEIIPGNGNRRW